MRFRTYVIPALFIALLVLVGCGADASESGLETDSTAPLAQDLEDVVSATGQVRPARWANLGFPVGGRVKTVHVEEGEEVLTGQPLVELDAVQLVRTARDPLVRRRGFGLQQGGFEGHFPDGSNSLRSRPPIKEMGSPATVSRSVIGLRLLVVCSERC